MVTLLAFAMENPPYYESFSRPHLSLLTFKRKQRNPASRARSPSGLSRQPGRQGQSKGGQPMLTLQFHPLSSYCHKVLIALYENGTPFEPQFLNLGNPAERQRYLELWPIGKMPI